MKLEGLLLERAVALNDKSTILQIFAGRFPEVLNYCEPIRTWSMTQNGFMPPYSVVLETPFISFHYSRGQFYTGSHFGVYAILHSRDFGRYAIL
jgi:hypothetical protein